MARIPGITPPGMALVIVFLSILAGQPGYGQVPVDDSGEPIGSVNYSGPDTSDQSDAIEGEPLTGAELENLIGPVALYPDDLLAIVLPASTYPLQIVQAARFLEARQTDSALQPDESWDESVVALLNYPEVIRLLNDDIDWTWQLGEAFISQHEDVIAAVESFRDRAYAAGNLKSDQHQIITQDENVIEIEPVEDDTICALLRARARRHPAAATGLLLLRLSPPGLLLSLPQRLCIFVRLLLGSDHRFSHRLVKQPFAAALSELLGHPYYGHNYFGHYYRRPSIAEHNSFYLNNSYGYAHNRFRDGDFWRPHGHHVGARQSDYYSYTHHHGRDSSREREHHPHHGNHRRAASEDIRHGVNNEVHFRHRAPHDSVRAINSANNRHGITHQPRRSATGQSGLSFGANRNEHSAIHGTRRTPATHKRASRQIRQTPPQRDLHHATTRPQQRQSIRSERNQPRRQLQARAQRPSVHRTVRPRSMPKSSQHQAPVRQRHNGSQHQEPQPRQQRAHPGKSKQATHRSGGDRQGRKSGRRELQYQARK